MREQTYAVIHRGYSRGYSRGYNGAIVGLFDLPLSLYLLNNWEVALGSGAT